MNLTYSTFCKVAKRHSARTGCTLSEAQEGLATDFGFKNFDAARKGLKDPAIPKGTTATALGSEDSHAMHLGSTGAGKTSAASTAWKGFSQMATYRLIEWLALRKSKSSESRAWTERGLSLLRAVLQEMAITHKAGFSAEQLRQATTIEWIEARCIDKHRLDETVWIAGEPLMRYLSFLPGYDVARLLANDAASTKRSHAAAHEHHAYFRMQLDLALSQLEAMEKDGLIDAQVREAISRMEKLQDDDALEEAGAPILQRLVQSGLLF